jgi:hypothetical protein
MLAPGLGVQNKEWASLAQYLLLGVLPRARPIIRQNDSIPQGNSVPLIVMESGNHFPAASEDGFPKNGVLMGLSPHSSCFSFGNPIVIVE